ncbi:MAG TPA: choice-of-anchor Q domain-containing protein [Candidatus Eisenbacteria bacterium]|nr:choice-of-anchor Q domain-containing protein [Candidatus Eisenbacteria bacterium]
MLVDPGTYVGSLRFNGKAVFLRSTSGAPSTVIVGNGGTAVDIGPGGELTGFTITGGQGDFGCGTEVHGVGTRIARNIYESNQPGGLTFATIWGNTSSPVIEGNRFHNNGCDQQHLSAVITFVNTSSPRIINNLFVDNPCRGINMTLPEGNQPQVINNTLVGNRAAIHVDGRIPTSLQVFRNNVIVGNQIGLEVVFGSGYPTWDHNLVYDNVTNYVDIPDQTGISGNLSVDPAFANRPGRDLHLTMHSPAVDAGSPVLAPDMDFDGLPRPIDGNSDGQPVVDMGAYELGLPTPVVAALVEASVGPAGVTLIWHLPAESGPVTLYRRQSTEDWTALSLLDRDGTGRVSYQDRAVLPGASYRYRLGIVGGDGETMTPEVEVLVPVFAIALHGTVPNPSSGRPLMASFTLASGDDATLELFDVAGRQIARREVGSLGTGYHVVPMVSGLDPGVYLVRLTQGPKSIQRKAVVTGP